MGEVTKPATLHVACILLVVVKGTEQSPTNNLPVFKGFILIEIFYLLWLIEPKSTEQQ